MTTRKMPRQMSCRLERAFKRCELWACCALATDTGSISTLIRSNAGNASKRIRRLERVGQHATKFHTSFLRGFIHLAEANTGNATKISGKVELARCRGGATEI